MQRRSRLLIDSEIRHIAIATRVNRSRYRAVIDGISLPKVEIRSTRSLAEFYRANGPTR